MTNTPEAPTITVDEADEIYYGKHVAVQAGDEHRWYTDELVVFERDPNLDLWGFNYMRPATEMQEDQDRYDDDPVPIFPVSAQEITTTVYKKS